VKAVVLDVEGTTTSIGFVHDVLFGYARARLGDFLRRESQRVDVRDALDALRVEYGDDDDAPPGLALSRYALWLIDRDRKSTPLKALQGGVWEEGYRTGELVGDLYPDVPGALSRWRDAGTVVAVFSSGSVPAQRMLFSYSAFGDLSDLIAAHFDTTTGPKRDPASYMRIAASLRLAPSDTVFVSDLVAELDAARAAGMRTALCARDGVTGTPGKHPVITALSELQAAAMMP
jgi:enolase-phosphatase E1